MSVAQRQAEDLARAYSLTLQAADRELLDKTERALLTALVAESAMKSRDYYATRHAHEPGALAALDRLASTLARHDVVGRTLARAKQEAVAAATDLAKRAVLGSAVPWWLSAVFALVGYLLLGAAVLGEASGFVTGVVVLLILSGAVAPILVLRGGAVAGQAASAAGRAIGQGVSRLHETVTDLGVPADTLFMKHAGPTLSKTFGNPFPVPRATTTVRSWASWVEVGSYVLAGIAIFVFLRGAWTGISEATVDACVYNKYTQTWIGNCS